MADNRKFRRIELIAKISCNKYLYEGKEYIFDEPFYMELVNISEDGIGVLSQKHFEKGAILYLNIKFEDIEYDKISTKVIWSIKKGELYRIGLNILNISGRLYSHIRKLENSLEVNI